MCLIIYALFAGYNKGNLMYSTSFIDDTKKGALTFPLQIEFVLIWQVVQVIELCMHGAYIFPVMVEAS